MQPLITINRGNYTKKVYSTYEGAKYGYVDHYIGEIYVNELFATTHDYGDGVLQIYFCAPNRSGRYGYIDEVSGDHFMNAYSNLFDFGYRSTPPRGYIFKVRRRCRIFEGETEVDVVNAGAEVFNGGSSYGGLKHPYRLAINAYKREDGTVVDVDNGWCDLDFEIGYSMANEITVYGNW